MAVAAQPLARLSRRRRPGTSLRHGADKEGRIQTGVEKTDPPMEEMLAYTQTTLKPLTHTDLRLI